MIFSGRAIACVVSGLIGCSSSIAAIYYVDAERGNDGSTGTAAVAAANGVGPWQSLGRVGTASLAAGDTIQLACGSVWAETLRVPASGAAGAPITIAAAPGCQTPPAIDGAVSLPAHMWTQHAGAIYRARLPIDLIQNQSLSTSVAGWTRYSPNNDATTTLDAACPGAALPCMAFVSGAGTSLIISNNFALAGSAQYTASVQVRAPAGANLKLIVRRGGPTYEALAPASAATGTGGWQTVTLAFRAAGSVANARMDVEVPGGQLRVNMREAHVQRIMATGGVIATFVDGVTVRPAHHPNFGQPGGDAIAPYAATASAGGRTLLDTTGLALPAGATLTTGLTASIRTVTHALEERAVSAVAGRQLTLSMPTDYDIGAGYGYFLTGALWMLDSPGESFFDATTSTLYVWMPDGLAPGARVAVSTVNVAIDIESRSLVNVDGLDVRRVGLGALMRMGANLTLSGLRMSDLTYRAINADNCAGCELISSRIERTGLDAIRAIGALTTNFNLADSDIIDSGALARTDGWRRLPRPALAAVNVGSYATILRNNISGAANIGIFLGTSSTAEENYVTRTCLNLNDCGGIYMSYAGNSSTIMNNLIDAVPGNLAGLPAAGAQFQTAGIYLDGGNVAGYVRGNTVTGAEFGIHLHDSSLASIRENVLYGNRRYQLWMQEQTAATRPNGDLFGHVIDSNLIVPTSSGTGVFMESEITDTADFATFIANKYSGLLSPRVVGTRRPGSSASYSLPEWIATGQDAGASVTAPTGYASFVASSTVNMVPNGALSNGITGWTAWNQTPPLRQINLRACAFGPCIELQAGASPTLLSSPNFSVTAGQWYRVTFDAATSQANQPINLLVRRGGGGSANYEPLMPGGETFAGATTWRRYSFQFQATKTVVANSPATGELGARVDFERVQPGTLLTVARLEMVPLTPATAALNVRLLTNPSRSAALANCPTADAAAGLCAQFYAFSDNAPIAWPTPVPMLSGKAIYTRDTSLTDADGDGVADQQDTCPGTPAGTAVNARGCGIGQ